MATLNESDLKKVEAQLALPSGWLSNLLSQFGPIIVQALITFLGGLLTPPAPTPAQAKAKVKCCPADLAALDEAIGKLTEGLCGVICHRNCCDCGD